MLRKGLKDVTLGHVLYAKLYLCSRRKGGGRAAFLHTPPGGDLTSKGALSSSYLAFNKIPKTNHVAL